MTDQPRILPDLTATDLLAKLAEMQAEIERLRSARPAPGKLTLKVSDKGCLMVLGLQRFPVTLYASQWERLLDAGDEIRTFMAAHASRLTRKQG